MTLTLTHGLLWRPPTHTQGWNWGVGGGEREWVSEWERDRETETDRQTEWRKERERQTDRQRQTDWQRHRDRERCMTNKRIVPRKVGFRVLFLFFVCFVFVFRIASKTSFTQGELTRGSAVVMKEENVSVRITIRERPLIMRLSSPAGETILTFCQLEALSAVNNTKRLA